MANNYYALVNKKTGKLPVLCSWLPIFWSKKMAKATIERSEVSSKCKIVKVNIKQLEKLVKDGESKQTRKTKGKKHTPEQLEAEQQRQRLPRKWACDGPAVNTGGIG